jgi:hypothetical protein
MRKQRLRVGRILATGFGLWLRRFLPIHAVTLLCLAPLALFPHRGNPLSDGTIPGLLGLHLGAFFLSADILFGPSAIAYRAVLAYLGQFAIAALLVRDACRTLSGGRTRLRLRTWIGLPAYAGLSLLAFVLLDVAILGMLRGSDAAVLVGLAVASLAQAILASLFWFAIPAAVVEGLGLFAALRRSMHLARGSVYRLAVPIVFLSVLQVASVAVLSAFVHGPDDPWQFAVTAVFFLTVKACILAAAYHEIRLIREGPRPEELRRVFA